MKKFIVYLWSGNGYLLVPLQILAECEEDALDRAVVKIESDDSYHFLLQDENVNEQVDVDDEEGHTPFLYVDATSSGAKTPHYIYAENLRIECVKN